MHSTSYSGSSSQSVGFRMSLRVSMPSNRNSGKTMAGASRQWFGLCWRRRNSIQQRSVPAEQHASERGGQRYSMAACRARQLGRQERKASRELQQRSRATRVAWQQDRSAGLQSSMMLQQSSSAAGQSGQQGSQAQICQPAVSYASWPPSVVRVLALQCDPRAPEPHAGFTNPGMRALRMYSGCHASRPRACVCK